MESQAKVKARWIAVNAKAMSVDHKPASAFEKDAARAIAAGKSEYEQVADGYYHRVGAIPLGAGCVNCHTGFFAKDQKSPRFAGLVISVPLAKDQRPVARQAPGPFQAHEWPFFADGGRGRTGPALLRGGRLLPPRAHAADALQDVLAVARRLDAGQLGLELRHLRRPLAAAAQLFAAFYHVGHPPGQARQLGRRGVCVGTESALSGRRILATAAHARHGRSVDRMRGQSAAAISWAT